MLIQMMEQDLKQSKLTERRDYFSMPHPYSGVHPNMHYQRQIPSHILTGPKTEPDNHSTPGASPLPLRRFNEYPFTFVGKFNDSGIDLRFSNPTPPGNEGSGLERHQHWNFYDGGPTPSSSPSEDEGFVDNETKGKFDLNELRSFHALENNISELNLPPPANPELVAQRLADWKRGRRLSCEQVSFISRLHPAHRNAQTQRERKRYGLIGTGLESIRSGIPNTKIPEAENDTATATASSSSGQSSLKISLDEIEGREEERRNSILSGHMDAIMAACTSGWVSHFDEAGNEPRIGDMRRRVVMKVVAQPLSAEIEAPRIGGMRRRGVVKVVAQPLSAEIEAPRIGDMRRRGVVKVVAQPLSAEIEAHRIGDMRRRGVVKVVTQPLSAEIEESPPPPPPSSSPPERKKRVKRLWTTCKKSFGKVGRLGRQ